jgi:hypothetical protein
MRKYEVAVASLGNTPSVAHVTGSLEEARILLIKEIEFTFHNDRDCADLKFEKDRAVEAAKIADVGSVIYLGNWIHGLRLRNNGANA